MEAPRLIETPHPALRATFSHKGRGNFSDNRFSYFISTRCLTRKCKIYTRLHIGSKTERLKRRSVCPGGSDIDLFGYGKSIMR
jgi:hypothetical protein